MDHGQVPSIGLLLIIVDAYSGWPEVIAVMKFLNGCRGNIDIDELINLLERLCLKN